MASRFVRKVRTASGAVAVQVVVKVHGEIVEVEQIGSAQILLAVSGTRAYRRAATHA